MQKLKPATRTWIAASLFALLAAVVLILPGNPSSGNVIEVSGTVISVDNGEILSAGAGALGIQRISALINAGEWKGQQVEAVNHLNGQLEMDEIYSSGDRILLAVQLADGQIADARAVNAFRQDWELVLFALFALSLVAYSGGIGLRALVSFLASLGILWCFFIPCLLKGASPLPLSLAVLVLLSMVIVLSVSGISLQGISAFLGTVSGLGGTLLLTLFFGSWLGLGGMTAPLPRRCWCREDTAWISSIFSMPP